MERIKVLFFNETLRRWHFEDIVKQSGMSRERVNFFLRELIREGFIKRTKPKKRMPYYTANKEKTRFRSEKRLYGLKALLPLVEHLNSLKDIRTAIVFGSFARGDWNKSSDVDLFVYGSPDNFEKGRMERDLKREIQLFDYQNTSSMKELDPKLIPNIMKGFNIKGNLEPFRVELNV